MHTLTVSRSLDVNGMIWASSQQKHFSPSSPLPRGMVFPCGFQNEGTWTRAATDLHPWMCTMCNRLSQNSAYTGQSLFYFLHQRLPNACHKMRANSSLRACCAFQELVRSIPSFSFYFTCIHSCPATLTHKVLGICQLSLALGVLHLLSLLPVRLILCLCPCVLYSSS